MTAPGTTQESELSLMASPSNRTYVSVTGSERVPLPGAQVVGPTDPQETVEVSIRLRSRAASGALEAAVAALGAQSPAQRTYLTAEQVAATYGADPVDVDRVAQFARAQGLTVVRTDVAQRLVVVSGSAQTVMNAFQVQLQQYTSPRGNYRGRVGPVQLPADVQAAVEGVFGLDNRPQARPFIAKLTEEQRARAATRAAKNPPTITLSTGPATPGAFTPPQVAILYDFPAGLTGAGQTIGIIEFGGGYNLSDLQTYFGQLNLPVPRVTAVSVDGVTNQPGKDKDADGEVALDIEIAASLAPGAQIVVYFAPFTEKGWVDVINAAIHDTQHRPSVLSISWGESEGQDIWTTQAVQTVNQVFQAAALQGITICCASGDDGSRDQVKDGRVHVDFPAGSPYVLACGGTTLQLSSTGLTGETVWNNGVIASTLGAGGATGGGISERNPLPSWQRGIVPPSANPGHAVGRGVPDVAGNADETTGYVIQSDGQSLPGVGGTSAVSPLWAALIARINQHLGKPVGFINPLLYSQLGKTNAFRDVTSGSNDPTGGQLGGYNSGPGWDACTGWGGPDGTRLTNALVPGKPIPVSPTNEPINPGIGGLLGNTGLLIGIAAVVVIAVVLFFLFHNGVL
jgi:kumamolisin